MLLFFKQLHRLKVLFVLAFSFTQFSLSGQAIPASGEKWAPADLKKISAKAQQYLSSAQPDSALLVLRAPLRYLKQNKQLNTPWGLEMQYIQAQSLEVDQQDSLALEALLHLKEASRNLENWPIYAKACLVLANLHEKLGRAQKSKASLEDARSVLEHHALDTVYTGFAIRMSSWQRIFGRRDSSQYYAQLALTFARKVGDLSGEAQAHLLLGALSANENYLEAIEHYQEAARLCEIINDYLGQTYYNNGIASLYLRNDQPEKALTYNTEGLKGVRNAAKAGYEENWIGHRAYQVRGEIFKALGQTDSAYFYARKGLKMELDDLRKSQQKEVAEIDAKYTDEKKSLQLAQQQREIHQGRQTRYLLIGIIFLILLIALVLAYSHQTQRRINKKVKEQAEQLQALDQMKSRFFANVSHELRTPLTLMLGPISHLLKEDHLTAKQTTLLQTAADSGALLRQLINEILDLRKLELNKMEIYREPTVLFPFFIQYISQFDSLAANKSICFSYEVAIDEATSADLDKEKTRQILQNLLSNAFKYTPDEQQVNVVIRLEEQILQLSVADTGRGIHPDDLPYIFNRYFQTNRRDSAMEGGTGIGLALCKEYTELLGGTIQVESTWGKGTTFSVSLPVPNLSTNEGDTEEAGSSSIPVVISGTLRAFQPITAKDAEKPRILVVEDQPALANYLRLLLADQYEVVIAQHGQKAWERLFPTANEETIHSFDLILSDLMMPVMDGYQLLEKLKSHDATRHIPVVMLTARAELRDKLKALRIGIDDYLIKPFEEEELLVRIANLLQNQANRKPETPAETSSTVTPPLVSEEDQQWLVELEEFVQKNLSNSILSVPMLAERFSMSESTLFRQMKHITGLSPVQYLQEVRLEKALRLLENHTYNSISKVAYKVGYTDPNSFTRAFRRRFGKSPSVILNS